MAKPPAGSSLLFGALADSGRIKQRKNGSYRMVLKGIDVIDWFTDRPDRVAGEWSPKKLVKKWDGLFLDVEPNAQATFEVGSKRELVTFEMFKPKLSDSNQTLSFKVRGIGASNKDDLTGLANKSVSDIGLFIDNSTSTTCSSLTNNVQDFFNVEWMTNFGPESDFAQNSAELNASGGAEDYGQFAHSYGDGYSDGGSSSMTPSQKYNLIKSSLQYVADLATFFRVTSLQNDYWYYESEELGDLLISGKADFGDIFTGHLGEGLENPWGGWKSSPLYSQYSNIASQDSTNKCF